MQQIGEKPFRAEQIFKWIYQDNATSFDEMTNLSLELREKLKKEYIFGVFNILKKQVATDRNNKIFI